MRIAQSILAALALAFSLNASALAAPCNGNHGCMIRARMCTTTAPEKCQYERLPQAEGVGLCTMTMMQAATVWIVGDQRWENRRIRASGSRTSDA